MYDVAIIGGGPAGVTAAIYAARKKLKTLFLTKDIGGQIVWTSDIENYPGFKSIKGDELAIKFEEHLKEFEIDTKRETAEEVTKENNVFKIKTKKNMYESKTVVIATGRKPRELGVKGETEFKNKGVAYCATCDAPLFEGKDVAVMGGGNSALEAVMQLMKIANKIYIFDFMDKMIADPIMLDKAKASKKVELYTSSKAKEIKGDKTVKSIVIDHNGKEKEYKIEGIFVQIGSLPSDKPTIKGINLNKFNEIIINEKCETNIQGLFAAGDITNVPEKQIIVAAGQGCIASISAFKYLTIQK